MCWFIQLFWLDIWERGRWPGFVLLFNIWDKCFLAHSLFEIPSLCFFSLLLNPRTFFWSSESFKGNLENFQLTGWSELMTRAQVMFFLLCRELLKLVSVLFQTHPRWSLTSAARPALTVRPCFFELLKCISAAAWSRSFLWTSRLTVSASSADEHVGVSRLCPINLFSLWWTAVKFQTHLKDN